MGSNLIYFIHLIQHTAINICIIKNIYFKNKVTYYISYSDWFSAIAFGFRYMRYILNDQNRYIKDGFIFIFSIHPTKYTYI